jgi:signal transduction histidine kinase
MTADAPAAAETTGSSSSDWILMGMRWLLGLGILVLNRLAPILPQGQTATQTLVLTYLVITLVEALLLWRGRALNAWLQVSLAVDIVFIVLLLLLNASTQNPVLESPLLPLLLLPVVATSLRLGFPENLGLNLASLAGYALAVVWDHLKQQELPAPADPNFLKIGLFGGLIVLVGVFTGMLAQRLVESARKDAESFREQTREAELRRDTANKRAQAFYEMSHTLSVTMSYRKVLDSILGQCRRLLDFSVGVVLLSATREALFVAASSGLRVSDANQEVRLTGGILSTCLSEAEPLLLENLGRDTELNQILALQRCRSGMAVPLRVGLRNYGVVVLGSIQPEAYGQAQIEQLTALAHFATIAIQNAQLYQDLRDERDKIVRAEENVRKELSRDLHDGPAQTLAAIAMSAEFIRRLLSDQPDKALQELSSLEQLARKTSWDVRTMLFELRPIILETQGLVPTLEQYVQRFPASEGIAVHLDTGSFDHHLDPEAATSIFTIMQEAVNNARKHANAKNIWLKVAQHDDKLVASVQDDGDGFDVEVVESAYDERGSFGLLNMEERARLIGGKTEILSKRGKGTAVIITVPLERR